MLAYISVLLASWSSRLVISQTLEKLNLSHHTEREFDSVSNRHEVNSFSLAICNNRGGCHPRYGPIMALAWQSIKYRKCISISQLPNNPSHVFQILTIEIYKIQRRSVCVCVSMFYSADLILKAFFYFLLRRAGTLGWSVKTELKYVLQFMRN